MQQGGVQAQKNKKQKISSYTNLAWKQAVKNPDTHLGNGVD